MVHRPSTDSSVHARIDTLAAKHDELARAQARGTTALRDAAGNVLTMGTGNDSMLASTANDVGVLFTSYGSAQITSSDGSSLAAIAAGSGSYLADLLVTGSITTTVGGVSSAGSISSSFNIHADGNVSAGGDISGNTLHAGVSVLGPTQTGDLTAGTCFTGDVHGLNIYSHGTLLTSDGRLKEGFAPADDKVLDRLLTAPVQRWRWKAKWVWDERTHGWRDVAPDAREHIHPVAQDLPPELVLQGEDGVMRVDSMSMVGSLLALVQRQQRQVDALTQRVEALERKAV